MRKIIPCLLLLLCCLVNALNSGAQKKYNVIFIAVDDLSTAFDAYGNPDAHAPNYARLMQHGVMFRQTYCQFALCSPSRTSLLSGIRPDGTGVTDNTASIRSVLGNSFKFIPEYFHSFGYRTEKYGKVTCGHEEEISWDFVYDNDRGEQYHVSGAPHWWIDTSDKTERETGTGIMTTEMIKKIDNPFATPYFYALGLETHNPFTPILNSWNKTGDPSVQELLPIDLDGNKTNVKGNGSANIILPDTPPDDTADIPKIALHDFIQYPTDEWQRIRHSYYSEIMQMDVHLGRVLDDLDRLNLWDSSIVVFFSDHGLQMGEHQGMWLKQSLFEESQRVPFVICAPGKKKGVVCNTVVELVDLFSTLAELCGFPPPPNQEGSSLVPLMENPNALWKKAVFSQQRRPGGQGTFIMARCARTNNFQYNNWQGNGEELYDIVNDPYEYTNLVSFSDYTDTLNAMRTIVTKGWAKAKPPVYTKSTFFKDADGDGYGSNTDSVVAYFAPNGYAPNRGDCDDNNSKINPDAVEKMCNGKDDNCNGSVDETLPKPTIKASGSLDICLTGSVTLSTIKGTGLSYQWKKNGVNIAGATQRTYTATTPGDYKVKVSNNTCSSTSDAVSVTSCSSIALNSEVSSDASTSNLKFSLYPNPSKGTIQIKYSSNYSGKVQLNVLDVAGRTLVSKNEIAIKGSNTFQLNLSNLAAGMYCLELNDNASQKRVKFLIER